MKSSEFTGKMVLDLDFLVAFIGLVLVNSQLRTVYFILQVEQI